MQLDDRSVYILYIRFYYIKYIPMKTTILKTLWIQQAVKVLMKDWNLTIQSKLDLVTLWEAVDSALKPFNVVRVGIIKACTVVDKDGKSIVDKARMTKEIMEATEAELEMTIESFKLETMKDDKVITAEAIAMFKQMFWDKFVLETS